MNSTCLGPFGSGSGLLCSLWAACLSSTQGPCQSLQPSESTGSLPFDWHLWMLPGQRCHVGNVTGHHCQMMALSTCWPLSLQTGSWNWYIQSHSYCVVLLFLVLHPDSICLSFRPLPSTFMPNRGMGDGHQNTRKINEHTLFILDLVPGHRKLCLRGWALTHSCQDRESAVKIRIKSLKETGRGEHK